ncbi:hypothetical protein GCM10022232_25740 [Streptomyces plumbiresistens]|uniref:Transposase n=1 Tax=Streptomyces plumbiresistens TaxID=511811 RepID=A0ABP7R085_9ACTN
MELADRAEFVRGGRGGRWAWLMSVKCQDNQGSWGCRRAVESRCRRRSARCFQRLTQPAAGLAPGPWTRSPSGRARRGSPLSSREAELSEPYKKVRELEEKRDILRKTAKCFAGDTRW